MVGQPTVSPQSSPKRSSGKSSVLHFHQPGMRHLPNSRQSRAVKTNTIIVQIVNSEIIAARCLTNRRRTIAPWLRPSVSLFAIAFSPESTVSVSTDLFLRLNISCHFQFGYVDPALNRVNQLLGLPELLRMRLRRRLPLEDLNRMHQFLGGRVFPFRTNRRHFQ